VNVVVLYHETVEDAAVEDLNVIFQPDTGAPALKRLGHETLSLRYAQPGRREAAVARAGTRRRFQARRHVAQSSGCLAGVESLFLGRMH
jgi:hypothetical protein